MPGPELVDVLGAIYDAALQPEVWPVALSQLAKLIGSTWVPLGILRLTGQPDLIVQDTDGDPEHLAFFRENFSTPETNPGLPLLMAGGPGTISLNDRDIPQKAWRSSGLYREVFKPRNLYYAAGVFVSKSDSHMVVLGACRPKSEGPYTPGDVELLRKALPHVERAAQTFLRVAELDSFNTANEAIWNSLACGVVLLDGAAKILWSNQVAAVILSSERGLRNVHGTLTAASRNDDAALQQLVAGALATTRGLPGGSGGALAVSRPAPARPLAVLVAPIRLQAAFVNRPRAAVFINDPQLRNESAPELMHRLYRLTAREAELVSLLIDGLDLRQAAERLGIKMYTARTHLKLVFEKTGTHRQAELVRLLLRGPLGTLCGNVLR